MVTAHIKKASGMANRVVINGLREEAMITAMLPANIARRVAKAINAARFDSTPEMVEEQLVAAGIAFKEMA